jgi:hypothetical protein
MRLLGKYTFETLRDCFQGVFEWSRLADGDDSIYIIELWQFRFIIRPLDSIEIQFNAGKEKGYISFGKIELTQTDR